MIELDNLLIKINNSQGINFNNNLELFLSKLKPSYPIILITGTNGKGSVCAYLKNILQLAGYKTGVYTSPHLLKYNERIATNNNYISDQELYKYLLHLIKELKYWHQPIGLFKLFTLVAHQYFIDQNIDIMICEVGIGGAHDITNYFEPDLSVITKVSLDHCQLLGKNRESIGYQKVQIFRANKPAIYGEADIPNSVLDYVNQHQVKLYQFNKDFTIKTIDRNCWHYIDLTNNNNLYSLPNPAMSGKQQIINASIAIAIVNTLSQNHNKFAISKSMIKQAISVTKIRGRFEILAGYPRVILDVAHNPDSVANMATNMMELGLINNIAVFAIAKNKDLNNIIKNCKHHFKKWYIAPINSVHKTANIDDIYQQLLIHKILNRDIIKFNTVTDAVAAAYSLKKHNYNIVIFGSFHTIAEAINYRYLLN